jgi:hypothetical protein
MPQLTESSHYTCFLCGSQANFISVNSKQYRCVEKITRCPGFVEKAEKSRQERISPEDRRAHMKLMSNHGNKKLSELHKDGSWRKEKSKNITIGKVLNGSAIDPSLKTAWKLYEDAADRHTRESWIYNQDKINPTNLPRGMIYELDHKYSKSYGFKNNVPPEIIGHWSNLRMIDQSSNRKKYNTCSITLEELYSLINSI